MMVHGPRAKGARTQHNCQKRCNFSSKCTLTIWRPGPALVALKDWALGKENGKRGDEGDNMGGRKGTEGREVLERKRWQEWEGWVG